MNYKLNTSVSLEPANTWRPLFEAALMESDHSTLPHRLQDAKDAVMDRIEDTFDTASLSERRLLLAALHTISELQRLSECGDVRHRIASGPNLRQVA